ncbi:MAG: hypothetical protein HY286_00915 [Planctomycetes bacterium]|nr:hypothetical protein [Planctomycetota bacterium]
MIRVAHLRAAFALWKYSEDSAIYIFGDSLGDPTADEILRSLRAAAPDGLTRTELIRMRGGHKSSADIGRALGVLLRERLARFERNETGGRPEEVWYAVAK